MFPINCSTLKNTETIKKRFTFKDSTPPVPT